MEEKEKKIFWYQKLRDKKSGELSPDLEKSVYSDISQNAEAHTKINSTRFSDYADVQTMYGPLRARSNKGTLFGGQTREHPGFYRNFEARTYRPNFKVNIIRSFTNTASSYVMKMDPRPLFLSDKGDPELARRSELLNDFALSFFKSQGVVERKRNAQFKGNLFGNGFLKVDRDWVDKTQISITSVEPRFVRLNEQLSYSAYPRELYHVMYVDKDFLKRAFPKAKDKIDAAEGSLRNSKGVEAKATEEHNFIEVIDAYRLADMEGEGSGFRVRTLSNCVLDVQTWSHCYYPFVNYHWSPNSSGEVYHYGIADDIGGMQLEINNMLRTYQYCLTLNAIPRVFVENNSLVSSSSLGSLPLSIHGYRGTPPLFHPGTAPHEAFIHSIEYFIKLAGLVTNMSQQMLTGEMKSNMRSAKAMQAASDQDSARFSLILKRYEANASILMSLVFDLISQEKSLQNGIAILQKQRYRKLNWDEIKISKEKFMLQAWPVNLMSGGPAAMLEKAEMLTNLGLLGPAELADTLDFPDVNKYTEMKTALADVVREDAIALIEGKDVRVDPLMNLPVALPYMESYYHLYKKQGFSSKKLENMRKWMGEAHSVLKLQEERLQSQMQVDPKTELDAAVAQEATLAESKGENNNV